MADRDNPTLKERITGLRVLRDQARADADPAQALLESPGHSVLIPAMIEGIARRARERIRRDEGGYRLDQLRTRNASRSQTTQFASWDRKWSC